jgi:predicted  nucleic acid-binding Zn-ribbon protein
MKSNNLVKMLLISTLLAVPENAFQENYSIKYKHPKWEKIIIKYSLEEKHTELKSIENNLYLNYKSIKFIESRKQKPATTERKKLYEKTFLNFTEEKKKLEETEKKINMEIDSLRKEYSEI